MSSRAFSASLDVPDATTRNYIDGRSKPSSEYLEKIVRRYAHINSTWLLTGEGSIFLTPTGNTGTNHIKNNTGQAIGINQGNATQITLEQCERDLAALHKEVEQLKQQLVTKDALLAAKDDLIAAKEEMLSLLRGGHNRPN